MGFSTSSTHMIFFIGAIIVAAGVAGVFAKNIMHVSSGIDERNNRLYQDLKTDITIINDPNNVPNNPLIIFVKNTGESQLLGADIQVLVDGYILDTSEYTTTVLEGNSHWNTSTVLQINVNSGSYSNLSTGDHYVKVVVYSTSDRMNFRI